MYKYILKRLVLLIPIMISISFIIFTIMYFTPGSPAQIILGDNATPEAVEELEEEMGLNEPFVVRYLTYIKDIVFHGDFGDSFQTGQPVVEEIMVRFPVTVKLAVLSMIVAILLGVICGVIAATKQYSIFDNVATGISLLGVSMPTFFQALLYILIFSVWLKVLPPSGIYNWKCWVMPVLAIGPCTAAGIMRQTRSSMLEVLRQDYIRTARAKGQIERIVVFKHALKNALIPVITVAGLSFGNLLGGAVIAESVFSIPGIGKYMLDSIKDRDYPVIQTGVLFIAIVFSVVNLLVDILYAYVDPRIKAQYKTVRKKKKHGEPEVSK